MNAVIRNQSTVTCDQNNPELGTQNLEHTKETAMITQAINRKPKTQEKFTMKLTITSTLKRSCIATLALAFASALSTAATFSLVDDAWPDSPALETVTNTDTSNGYALKADRGEFVQSVTTTTAFQIDKIYIEVRGLNNNVDFQLRIFEMADVTDNTAGTVVLAPLTMNTGSTGPGPNPTGIVLEFDLVGAEQITLAASQGYGIGLSSLEADGDQSIFTWNWTTSDIYTDGRAFGANTDADVDRTLAFTAFTAVPEPSSFALIGLGCLSLVLRRRRA